MRKATGKVVSLVLALALVITSFSATFASAATTSETGISVSTGDDTIVLSNLNGLTSEEVAAAKANNEDKFNLSAFVRAESIETYDHIFASNEIEISSVSVSGDNVIKVTKDNDTDNYVATLRGDKVTGTATVNVLYTAKAERGEDEITVRGTKKFTVIVIDAATPVLTSEAIGTKTNGTLDAISDLQKNPQVSATASDTGYATATNDTDKDPIVTADAYVYLPSTTDADSIYKVDDTNDGSAVVTYNDVTLVKANANSSDKDYSAADSISADNYDTYFVVSASGTDNYLTVATSDTNKLTYGIADPSVGNTVRLTVSSLKKEDSKFLLNKTVLQDTSKVVNKVVGDIKAVKMGDGTKYNVALSDSTTVTSKSKIYALIEIDRTSGGKQDIWWDVTGADLEQTNASAGLSISDGRLASVKVSGAAGDITLTDVTVSGTVSGPDDVEVTGGSVGKITDVDTITISDGAVVTEIDSGSATVTVTDGKVTGSLKANDVDLKPDSEEAAVSVGNVTATTLEVDGTTAAATVSSFKADNAGSVLLLEGGKASIGSINVDYRNTEIKLDNFVGNVPAPEKANFTGYEATGATLRSEDTDTNAAATKATVVGALKIRYIELNSGAVTFSSSIEVNEVAGGEADFIVNPGALRITESVATSNILKLANAADVKAGTVVYYTANDIADVDSFQRFGYDLSMKASGSYDVYTISGVDFAGLTLDATSVELVKGETAVVTASAYPNGTNLPENAVIAFYFNGDDSYVKGYKINDTQAELVAVEYNAEFSVLNEGTLTAQVEDEYGIQLEEYGEATCTVKVVAQKAPTETYKSDTTGDVVVASGNTYQFKITSLNGQAPSVVLGSAGVFELVGTAQEGNDYFFKFQAVGASGAATGVYVNGDAKVATMYVDGNTGYTCDTTTVNVPAGGTYQVKITAASMPTLAAGNSIYTVAFASQEGNDYFFKITATSAQAGDVVGFYINGGARAFVATTV